MAELAARAPTDGLDLPLAVGAARLAARPLPGLLAVMPFRGRADAVAATLGAALPAPGTHRGAVAWAGLDLWHIETADPELAARLAADAAVTDQSDAWAALALDGRDARAVLARLVPLDLDPAGFPDDAAARTLLRHVPCALLRRGGSFEIRVPRSYAATAHHDLATAMRAVAARTALGRR